MRNPKIPVVHYVQPKGRHTILQVKSKNYCRYLWNYKTYQEEISGQYLDSESVSRNTALWRRNKSKMADGRHFEDS